MASRDTTTGSNYEAIIEMCIKRSCEKNNLEAISQANIGIKPGGGKHRVDWEIIDKQDPNSRGLISCKYQVPLLAFLQLVLRIQPLDSDIFC